MEVARGRGQGFGAAGSGSRSRWRAMAAATMPQMSGARELLKAKRPSPESQRRPASKENTPWTWVTQVGNQCRRASTLPASQGPFRRQPRPPHLVRAKLPQEVVGPSVEGLGAGSLPQLDGVLAQHQEVGPLQLASGGSLSPLHHHGKLTHCRQAGRHQAPRAGMAGWGSRMRLFPGLPHTHLPARRSRWSSPPWGQAPSWDTQPLLVRRSNPLCPADGAQVKD